MAKFSKKIVTPKTHPVGRLTGKTEMEAITPARIKSWVENTNKLREHGVLIPAPFAHQDKNKKLAFPVIMGKDGETLADAYSGVNQEIPPAWDLANLNAGYWDDFSQDTDGNLIGEVDVPNVEKAQKIGTEIKQTSVLVMPSRKVMGKDGSEFEVGEHLAHVSMCLHAQENGQDNFVPLDLVPAGMAMSFILMDDITGLPDPNKPKDPVLFKVISLLRSSLGVALPEETTRENFLDSLTLVLTQKLADQQEADKGDNVTNRPDGTATREPSIAMSQTTQTSDKPNTVEVLLMSQLTKSRKKELQDRVTKLQESGRVSKDYVAKVLQPKLDAFTMSAADLTPTGDFNRTILDDLLDGLEQAQPLVGPSLLEDAQPGLNDVPLGAETQNIPADVVTGTQVAELNATEIDTVLDSIGL